MADNAKRVSKDGSSCVATCETGEILGEGNQCEFCKDSGKIKNGAKCEDCSSTEIPNEDGTACVKKCSDGEAPDSNNNCVSCSIISADGSKCLTECKAGEALVDKKCTICKNDQNKIVSSDGKLYLTFL